MGDFAQEPNARRRSKSSTSNYDEPDNAALLSYIKGLHGHTVDLEKLIEKTSVATQQRQTEQIQRLESHVIAIDQRLATFESSISN